MNPRHLEILQHALGCDKYGHGSMYRNRFVAGPGGDDFGLCRELVEVGQMADHGPQTIAGGMHCFTVTDAGKTAMREASPNAPKLTRSQERYRRFLKSDLGITFREWLNIREVAR